MSDLKTPFRYDYVGSFLRPEKLKKARADYETGTINAEQLKSVEDECIIQLVNKIKELGYHVITDGEFRRATWHLDFMWGFQGIEHKKTVDGNTTFDAEAAMIDDTYMVGKISVKNHPFVEHFKFVKALEDENTVAKQTIPSPGQFYAYFTGTQLLEDTLKIYGTEDAFAEDVIKAYGEFINELYGAGCRNLQFDDCVWGGMVNPELAVELTGRKGEELNAYKRLVLKLNNDVVAQAPQDLIINTHVCRGNYHSTFFSSGAYNDVADLLFGEENVNAYYLEFDDERSGGFEPLAKISGDKKVVLGLITTKKPDLENKEEIVERIKQAAKYVPLDRLYLSPQCGFASCEIGNKLTEEEQWAKLKLVKEIAEEVWNQKQFTSTSGNGVNLMQVFLHVGTIVWLIGVLGMLAYTVVTYILLKRRVRASIRTEQNIHECDDIPGPFILGIVRPKIYCPSGMTGEKRHLY